MFFLNELDSDECPGFFDFHASSECRGTDQYTRNVCYVGYGVPSGEPALPTSIHRKQVFGGLRLIKVLAVGTLSTGPSL